MTKCSFFLQVFLYLIIFTLKKKRKNGGRKKEIKEGKKEQTPSRKRLSLPWPLMDVKPSTR